MADQFFNNQALNNQDKLRLLEDGEEVSSRIIFLRRLYFMIFLQYICISVVCYCAYRFSDFKSFLQNQIAFVIVWSILAVLIALATHFGRPHTNKMPVNLIVYVLFAAAISFTFAYFVAVGHKYLALMIFVTAALIVMALFCSVLTSKSQITYQSSSLFVVGALVLSFNIFMLFTNLSFVVLLFVCIAELVWAFFLVYDTQSNMTGSSKRRANDDPISGAVLVYVDILIILARTCDLLRQLILRERS